MTQEIKKGDYVLATKWQNGDPKDQWSVGFFDRMEDKRYYIVDHDNKQLRMNGFRRIAKISQERGAFLIKNINFIEWSGYSLWYWKRCKISDKKDLELNFLKNCDANF